VREILPEIASNSPEDRRLEDQFTAADKRPGAGGSAVDARSAGVRAILRNLDTAGAARGAAAMSRASPRARQASFLRRAKRMTGHDLGSLGVGKLLTTPEFTVSAADLTAHVESSFMVDVMGTAEECLSTGSIGGASSAGAWGRVCPTGVAVDRVLSALALHEALRELSAVRRSVGRVRALGEILVGEPLSATAEVRDRSGRNPGRVHVTLEVEVHRLSASGGARRATVLSFEVGLELAGSAAA
jgi:hypothetical protein